MLFSMKPTRELCWCWVPSSGVPERAPRPRVLKTRSRLSLISLQNYTKIRNLGKKIKSGEVWRVVMPSPALPRAGLSIPAGAKLGATRGAAWGLHITPGRGGHAGRHMAKGTPKLPTPRRRVPPPLSPSQFPGPPSLGRRMLGKRCVCGSRARHAASPRRGCRRRLPLLGKGSPARDGDAGGDTGTDGAQPPHEGQQGRSRAPALSTKRRGRGKRKGRQRVPHGR